MTGKQFYYSREIHGKQVFLDKKESGHCIRVMRQREGDEISVLDGNGHIYRCVIVKADPEKVILQINRTEKTEPLRKFHLHVGIGPTKNINRFEFFLEKATEIGIDEITPVISRYSERRKIRTDRMEKILVAAIKQSGQDILPLLHPPVSYREFTAANKRGSRFIALSPKPGLTVLAGADIMSDHITLLIGPEGGFTGEEVQMAVAADFIPVSLGRSRLRTETAGITAVAAIHFNFMIRAKGNTK